MDETSYRVSKVVDWTIRDTSIVLFDDELYHQAINFLSNSLHAGGSNARSGGNTDNVVALAPSPEQLALLSTIVVHPLFTNRCSSAERGVASNLALRLLRDVTKVVGPVAADFSTAFAFTLKSSRRDVRRRGADTDSSDGDAERQLENKFAKQESVWSQTEDFWHVVGWALNCSVREPKRWTWWSLWLEWILDAMEHDWTERIRLAEKLMKHDETAAKDHLLGSLIYQYLQHLEGRNGRRRMMRAILATGDQKSLNEFPEVWKNETKERKRKHDDVDSTPTKRLNLDQDDFGDYGIDEDEDDVESDGQQADVQTAMSDDEDHGDNLTHATDPFHAGTMALGGLEAINIRHRFMSIIYRVALDLSYDFTHVEELFDLYTETIRPLPLAQFSVLSANPYLHSQARLALLVNHLLPLQNAHVRLRGGDILQIDQNRLAQEFFPKAANSHTTIDNAKISLAIEAALLTIFEHPGIDGNTRLRNALEEGIRARRKKAVADGRKKGKGMVGDESIAKAELERSSNRIMALLEVVETNAGISRSRTHYTEADMTSSSLSELSSASDDDD